MANTFFQATQHKVGASMTAGAKVNYILRQKEYAVSSRARVEHLTHDTIGHRRDDCLFSATHNMPEWADGNGEHFFTAAQRYERGRGSGVYAGVIMVEWKFSLPRELTRTQQVDAAQRFLTQQFGTTHPYVYALHAPQAADGGENAHIHCLWSSRTLDGIERSAPQFFRRYNPNNPGGGGAKKDRRLAHLHATQEARHAYADAMNLALEQAGQAARLDPRSLVTRGLDRSPEPRPVPSHSNKARYRGIIDDEWRAVLQHRKERQAHNAHEQRLAQQYWEQRKRILGLTHTPGVIPPTRERLTTEIHLLQESLATVDRADATTPQHLITLAAIRHRIEHDEAPHGTGLRMDLDAQGYSR